MQLSKEELNLFVQEQLLQAHKARNSMSDFFEYVIREETTGARLTLAPHQKIVLDFIQHHDRAVIMMPPGHSKTFLMSAVSMYFMGKDPTVRGALISSTETQAAKPLSFIKRYIEESKELRLVFPKLQPTVRKSEKWTQTAITIDRDVPVRDATMIAVGIDGALDGARLSWIVIDDILTMANTATKEQRDKVCDWTSRTVTTRLDPHGGKCVVTNTAWHPDDLCHRLEKQGWPTLRMSVDGTITISCPPIELFSGEIVEDTWGIDDAIAHEMRPSTSAPNDPTVRLTAHDPDPDNKETLWPQRVSQNDIPNLIRLHGPQDFNKVFCQKCRDDETARCKEEWIEACKEAARNAGYLSMRSFSQTADTFTGVDLAVSRKKGSDDTAFFTFEILPDGRRLILDVEIGKYDGPTIVKKMLQKHKQFNSIIRVETNAAQDFVRQFALQQNISLPVKAHNTGSANKYNPQTGVESLFIEIFNGAWLIPNNRQGQCHPMVQKFIDACLYYNPNAHTPDILMASHFARVQAMEFGHSIGGAVGASETQLALLNLSSR